MTFGELPLEELDNYKFSVYIIDYNWSYLFANEFAKKRLGQIDVVGKRIQQVWAENPQFNFQSIYSILKPVVDEQQPIQVRFKSPIDDRVVEINGYPLRDCYYFTVGEANDKAALIGELRSFLRKPFRS